MKFLVFTLMFSSLAFAKMEEKKGKFFVSDAKGKMIEAASLNDLIKSKGAKDVKLLGEGKVNAVTANVKGTDKVLSIDEKGFFYDLAPFSGYHVESVSAEGKIKFKEDAKLYTVDSKGYFLY